MLCGDERKAWDLLWQEKKQQQKSTFKLCFCWSCSFKFLLKANWEYCKGRYLHTRSTLTLSIPQWFFSPAYQMLSVQNGQCVWVVKDVSRNTLWQLQLMQEDTMNNTGRRWCFFCFGGVLVFFSNLLFDYKIMFVICITCNSGKLPPSAVICYKTLFSNSEISFKIKVHDCHFFIHNSVK